MGAATAVSIAKGPRRLTRDSGTLALILIPPVVEMVRARELVALLLLLLAHAGWVWLFCLHVKELSNLYRPKPQVCWGEWGGVLGAVEKVTCCVGGKGTGRAKVGDGAVEAG